MHQALQKKNQTMEDEIKAYKEQRKDLKVELEQKQDDYEQVQTKLKTHLQTVALQSERLDTQKKLLEENLGTEQEKRAALNSEVSQLKYKENDLKQKLM